MDNEALTVKMRHGTGPRCRSSEVGGNGATGGGGTFNSTVRNGAVKHPGTPS